MGQAPLLSTTKHSNFAHSAALPAIPVFKPFFTGSPPAGLGAALEPHSSDVLAGDWEVQDVRGEPPLSVASDPSRSPVWVIDRDESAAASCRRLDSTFIGSIEAAVSCVRSGATVSARGTTFGSSQAARTPIQSGCGRRSRQRAAAFGGWRHRRRHRSPPRFGAVVFRHNPDRRLRRGPHGRRRFCLARRRNQFRHRAGADREHAPRRHRRDRRQARQPQERPAAAGRRNQRHAPGASASATPPRSATAKSCERARSSACLPTSP